MSISSSRRGRSSILRIRRRWRKKIAALAPDVVVNAAAFTAVDQAESDPARAMTVNAEAAGEVARGAGLTDAPVIQISTDYVYDGGLDRPWLETDPVNPLGAYGRSKLAGEGAVAAANSRHVILRTAWVYSPFGNNFVKTMLRLAATRDEIGVVADQVGSPTSAFVIAEGILAVARMLMSDRAGEVYGIYHLAGTGSASWHEFASAIFNSARLRLPRTPAVRAITTADYPTPAQRPANSSLATDSFAHVFGYRAPHWRVSLDATLDRLLA